MDWFCFYSWAKSPLMVHHFLQDPLFNALYAYLISPYFPDNYQCSDVINERETIRLG